MSEFSQFEIAGLEDQTKMKKLAVQQLEAQLESEQKALKDMEDRLEKMKADK